MSESAVLGTMKEAGRGRIVSISSRAALGKEMRTACAASKAGLITSLDDIAHAAAFFLDQRSGFVTGQVLYACGGAGLGTAPI